MPRRDDIQSICILGSGPIVIGQACEFDYSGTQAIRALKREGYRIILINSNPATIMTDPDLADATYIEPLTPDFVERILRRECPDALLPTMGGQTALNLAQAMVARGVLENLGIELIGATPEVIERAENRAQFQKIMNEIGVSQPRAGVARTIDEAWGIQEELGFPAILRPSYTMGGSGGNIAYNREEFDRFVKRSIAQSPTGEVLIDESLLGWKEFELEVMRDHLDNVVIICGIENLDPLGIHTGDSITVAPIQTLSDREYQAMRDDALKIIRAVGVETGGCNIQFAVDPKTGRRVVIEMNPRVSRSSALASKATGYPIAKVAALLAVGYSLDEIQNDITATTSAAFEPVLDYTVVKMPRFAFEKFPNTTDRLTTQMKAVGEVMSIARTLPEALNKAALSLEIRERGFEPKLRLSQRATYEERVDYFRPHIMKPTPRRLWYIFDALRHGVRVEDIHRISSIDPWFLSQINRIVACEERVSRATWPLSPEDLMEAKRLGLSDARIAELSGTTAQAVRQARHRQQIRPVFKQVDTCAAEFEAVTSYFYSTYERGPNEATRLAQPSVMILGGGPNRIGQGIEFDYCAVHAALALRQAGYRTIMVNCNPETVSTDYDISDRLYFEPLTFETVMEIVENEDPVGVILQFGGQTPLKLSRQLSESGVRILGTNPEVIHRTEDREEFNQIVEKLALRQPAARTVRSLDEAVAAGRSLDYPLLVRPSYVLGGLGMEIVYDEAELIASFERARAESDESPVLVDRFLNQAVEVDVDCICDGDTAVIAGIMEHVEEAGVHSGDSAFVTPPFHLSEAVLRTIRKQTLELAEELDIIGLMNVQFAVQDHDVYILEVNPRASRTIPFISKAIGVPLAGLAARVMLDETLADLDFTREIIPQAFFAKESVFPFGKFPEVDTLLGPEMKSTGEVMGIDPDFNLAYLKAEIGAANQPPSHGCVFVSVRDDDKWALVPVVQNLVKLGFDIIATRGTCAYLRQHSLDVQVVNKVKEGQPHILDALINGDVDMVINTTAGAHSIRDSLSIRRTTLNEGIPYFTRLTAARAAASAMKELAGKPIDVRTLQEYQQDLARK